MTQVVLLALKVAILLLILGIGMSSTRHVGIAVLVAAALVIAYLLASIAVTVPYLHWRQKSAAKQIQ